MSSISLDYGSISTLTTYVSGLTDQVDALDTKITDSGLMTYGFNVALGPNSLPNIPQYIALNTAIGSNTMNSNIHGVHNTAVGANSLSANMYSSNITSIGCNTLQNLTNGEINTCVGAYTGLSLLNGSNNTIIGGATAMSLSDGNNNTIIGANINLSSNTASNQIAIGTGDGTKRATFNGTNWIFSSIPPVSVDASGVMGEIAFDSSFIYYCIATDTWARTELSSW